MSAPALSRGADRLQQRAISHLAAAIGVPWLPGTVLVAVKRVGDPDRPVDSMRFGVQYAPRLLERNRDIVLHQMHDQFKIN